MIGKISRLRSKYLDERYRRISSVGSLRWESEGVQDTGNLLSGTKSTCIAIHKYQRECLALVGTGEEINSRRSAVVVIEKLEVHFRPIALMKVGSKQE